MPETVKSKVVQAILEEVRAGKGPMLLAGYDREPHAHDRYQKA